MLLRKTVKQYGTGKLIEGVYSASQRCLVVEDVMVSGQGIYEACEVTVYIRLSVCNPSVCLDMAMVTVLLRTPFRASSRRACRPQKHCLSSIVSSRVRRTCAILASIFTGNSAISLQSMCVTCDL